MAIGLEALRGFDQTDQQFPVLVGDDVLGARPGEQFSQLSCRVVVLHEPIVGRVDGPQRDGREPARHVVRRSAAVQ